MSKYFARLSAAGAVRVALGKMKQVIALGPGGRSNIDLVNGADTSRLIYAPDLEGRWATPSDQVVRKYPYWDAGRHSRTRMEHPGWC